MNYPFSSVYIYRHKAKRYMHKHSKENFLLNHIQDCGFVVIETEKVFSKSS